MKTKLHFIALFLWPTVFSFGQATWTSLQNFPGVGRLAATSFTIGSTIYYTTGYDGRISSTLGDTYACNTSTGTWSQKTSFTGVNRYFATSFVIGGNAYVGGGKTSLWGQTAVPTRSFFKYDPVNDNWSQVSVLTHGRPRTMISRMVDLCKRICSEWESLLCWRIYTGQ